MTNENLFKAIGEAREEYVTGAAELFERDVTGGERMKKKKLGRTLLIAAVVTALLTATAYATGAFALIEERLGDTLVRLDKGYYMNDETGKAEYRDEKHEYQVLVPNGEKGSAEYNAANEWAKYQNDELNELVEAIDNGTAPEYSEFEADEEHKDLSAVYFVQSQEELDKLLKIQEESGLRMLTERTMIYSFEQLEEFVGVPNYTYGEDVTTQPLMYYFEDGSFASERGMIYNDCEYGYRVTRVMAGSFYPYGRNLTIGEGGAES